MSDEPAATYLGDLKSHFTTVAGHKWHYLDEGSGPVVVCLHGNPTWSYYFRHLVRSLRDSFRVIVPDYIGCGLSDHPKDEHFRAVDRANHLEEFFSGLGLKRFSLVMHDWGAPIGTKFAVKRPEQIERLVYLNTTLTETEMLPFVIKLAATPFIGKFLTKTTKSFLRLTTSLGVYRKLPSAVRHGYYYPYQTSERRTAIWDFVADIPFDNSHPTYREMFQIALDLEKLRQVPVQIVWGLRDPCFHRDMLTQVAKHFPQAGVLEIPDASHLVLEDAPEQANATIKSFLLGERDKSAELSGDLQASPLYEAMVRCAEATPRADAVISPTFIGSTPHYLHTSYQDFLTLVQRYERGLTEFGVKRGDKAVMLVSPGTDFLALTYALFGRGALPVFMDPGMGVENLVRAISHIKPEIFIGSPRAQIFRFLKRSVFKGLKLNISASEISLGRGPSLSLLRKFASKPLPAAGSTGNSFIAFTSGATGMPKGVWYTDQMVSAQLEIFRNIFGLSAGSKDIPLLPVFSIFNIALGVASVFPPMNPSKPLQLEPSRVVRIINDLSCDYSFGSPTLWNKIAEFCVRSKANLPSLRKIHMAGAPVSTAIRELVQGIIPNGEVYTPYGATEALPVTLAPASELGQISEEIALGGERGTLVGRVIPGVEAVVVPITDEPIKVDPKLIALKPYEIGELLVCGKNINAGYVDLPEADAKGKVVLSDRVWHRMGDVVYLDRAGNIYFCGRKAHIVTAKGHRFFSIPVERIFNQHPWVRRSALIRVGNDDVGIVVEPLPENWPATDSDRETFLQELRSLGATSEITRFIEHFYFHSSFPVDARHNAKIFRDKLGEWAGGQASEARLKKVA